jgi:hypothetical protein
LVRIKLAKKKRETWEPAKLELSLRFIVSSSRSNISFWPVFSKLKNSMEPIHSLICIKTWQINRRRGASERIFQSNRYVNEHHWHIGTFFDIAPCFTEKVRLGFFKVWRLNW